ncbi:unnamed protein product [Urochloa decumbens]|uniref:PDZ domain-containing protein n=1 Tax=Urochloa decumbens TaxID=240449 RepID=A0ABC8W602_9POAL
MAGGGGTTSGSQSRARKRQWCTTDEDEAARTGNEEQAASAADEAASSLVSSPCRCPCLPLVVTGYNSDGTELYDSNINPDVFDAYLEEEEKYCAKLEREKNLLTLTQDMPRTCLESQELLPVRDSATDMVLQAAKSVMGLSSYIDGKPLAQSTGFFIDWDNEKKVGTILTSAHIICAKYPSIHDRSSTREYAVDAKVEIHLSRGTSVDGCLVHYHKYYNIALFEVSLKQSPQLLCLNDEVKYAQEVFLLGRNERLQLNVGHGRVQFMDPGLFEQNHYVYVNCKVSKCGAGGPAVNFDGKVVGMADPTPRTAFIPISILVRCLHMQKEFKCIPRLHLGLKFSSIKFLKTSHIEEIMDAFSINSGLIVKQVSEGSIAEKVGIRNGDIVRCLNGEHVSTTVDLEHLSLRICEDHFTKGNVLGSNLDIAFEIFNIRKKCHLSKMLAVNVSDDTEVIRGGTYLVSATEALSNLVSSGDLSPD